MINIKAFKDKVIWLIVIILAIGLFSGCSGQKKEEGEEGGDKQKGGQSGQSNEQPPESLTGIEKGIESLIMSLNGPAAMTEEMQQSGGQQQGGTQSGGSQGGTQSGGSQSGNQSNQSGGQNTGQDGQSQMQSSQGQQGEKQGNTAQQVTTGGSGSTGGAGAAGGSSGGAGGTGGAGAAGGSSGSTGGAGAAGSGGGTQAAPITITNTKGIFKIKMTDSDWEGLISLVNNLHYQWNSFEPEAAQKGAGKELLDQFGNALNLLTDSTLGKHVDNCVFMANLAYSYIPDFFRLYKSDSSPELKRIRYYIRNCVLSSLSADWTQAGTDLENLKSLWNAHRMLISKDFPEASGMLEYSTMELEKVVMQKNQPLSDIKGRIALSNVVSIEKLLEKQLQGEGGEGGQGGS